MFQILMSVPVEFITAVSMHPALTLWAATTVLAMLVMLEMGLIAVSSFIHIYIYGTDFNIHRTQCM